MAARLSWTVAMVEDRLRAAADVIKRLPKVEGPAGFRSLWPDHRMSRFGYDSQGETAVKIERPRGREIDEAWEAADWLDILPPADARILWLWAQDGELATIGAAVHRTPKTIRRRIDGALRAISWWLNVGKPVLRRAGGRPPAGTPPRARATRPAPAAR